MGFEVSRPPLLEACQAVREPSIWDLGNDVLYELCGQHPTHQRDEEIVAKVWLIGRSYAASIERGKLSDLDAEAFYSSVVAPVVRASSLDQDLRGIGAARQCLNIEDVACALGVHDNLTKIFRDASGKANRSLASKYLHFHRPRFFPIFDSRANGQVRRMVLGQIPRGYPLGDLEYRSFLARFLFLRDWIANEHGLDLTPRQMDRVLLGY